MAEAGPPKQLALAGNPNKQLALAGPEDENVAYQIADIPSTLSKWFMKILLIVAVLLMLGSFVSVIFLFSVWQFQEIAPVVTEIAIAQNNSLPEIQASIQAQESTVNNIDSTLIEILADLENDIASVRSENAKPLAKLNEGLERNSLELLHVGEVLHSFMLGLEEVTIQIFDGKTEENLPDYKNGLDDRRKVLDAIVEELHTVTSDIQEVNSISAVQFEKLSILWSYINTFNLRDIRLSDGGYNYGRVELRFHNIWGTVCDIGWDINDGHVVCKMLGYDRATSAGTGPAGSGRIWTDDVSCNGGESHLRFCGLSLRFDDDCTHDNDASVVCEDT